MTHKKFEVVAKLIMCTRGAVQRTKEQKPPFLFSPLQVYHVVFSKEHGAFLLSGSWFLVGQDRVSVVISMRKREGLCVLRNQTVKPRGRPYY